MKLAPSFAASFAPSIVDDSKYAVGNSVVWRCDGRAAVRSTVGKEVGPSDPGEKLGKGKIAGKIKKIATEAAESSQKVIESYEFLDGQSSWQS